MSTPVKCPVCEGRGKVPNGFYNVNPTSVASNTDAEPETCKTCYGKGILWARDDKDLTPPIKGPVKKRRRKRDRCPWEDRKKKPDNPSRPWEWPQPWEWDKIYIGDTPPYDTITCDSGTIKTNMGNLRVMSIQN